MEVDFYVYTKLRELELALTEPGAVEGFRDVGSNTLTFITEVSRVIDNYERAYPNWKSSIKGLPKMST